MSKPGDWSLEGDAPEAVDMPAYTPEEAAAIREEVAKVDPSAVSPTPEEAETLAEKREQAIKRGKAKAARQAKAEPKPDQGK